MFKILKHIKLKKDIVCFKITNWLIGKYIVNMQYVPREKKFKYLYSMWEVVLRYSIFKDRITDDVIDELDNICKKLNINNNIRKLYTLTFVYSMYELTTFIEENGIET